MSKKIETGNLPTVQGKSFDLAIRNMDIDPALLAEVETTDFTGYEPSRTSLPIVSIRQKPLVDERGKTIIEPGGFRIYDPVTVQSGLVIPDQPSLDLTFMTEHSTRTFWEKGNLGNPNCRAGDGKFGIGSPGGDCAKCPMAQWTNGDRPPCTFNANVLAWDHSAHVCYVKRFGRSGLRAWGNFKELVKRFADGQMPIHAMVVHLTTHFETEPAPHYIPVIEVAGQVGLDLFRKLKQFRQEYLEILKRTSSVDTVDEDHPMHDTTATSDLPDGVTPVDNSLPY